MAFVLSSTSLPSHSRDSPHITMDNPIPHVYPTPGPSAHDHDMAKEKEHKPRIEILLDSPYLFLKGVGVDVEPTRLSGHVAIYLNEAMPIKEITLQFRGKARLPVPPSETVTMNASALSYIVCTHDWSFLEGEKRSSHTLKAGRHLFPFQLRIGGSLPSAISSPAFGGAAVSYKLRAHVVRHGFAFNQTYHACLPIHIIRSFAPEAMEYQQSLEIENTWPEKLMYSIMLPHKAWAAGDKLTGLVKFSPLAKGVCVLNVSTSIYEQTKVYARSGSQEHTRIVASTKHEFIHGRAVEVVDSRAPHGHSPSIPSSPASPASPPSGLVPRTNSSSSLSSMGRQYLSQTPIHATTPSPTSFPFPPSSSNGPVASSSSTLVEDPADESENGDTEAYLTITIPLTVTPTHSVEPIVVSHRIRWSILILNLDGHTSELRCSLPLHLLDYRLLNESKIHTAATRRLLIGDTEVHPEEEEDAQLPSYHQHIRDRVANMFLPDSATMRVTNPWISQGASPVHLPDAPPTTWPISRSGHSTPLEAHRLTNLPHQPDPNASNTPLEWVNSELLLSLSDNAPPRLRPHSPHRGESGADSEAPSRTHSRSHSRSRPQSRGLSLSHFSSRATSPERDRDRPHPHPAGSSHETYVHGGHASRNLHSLFTTTMRPFSTFSAGWITRAGGGSPHPTQALSPAEVERERDAVAASRDAVRTLSLPLPDRSTGTELLHRAFTAVPDYAVASRGFIGGVPSLESMRGLPSYEETVRTQSDSDLAARFGRMSTSQEGSLARPPLASSLST